MKKVFIGMSGGVDSSVSALLLKKNGFEVEGVNFKLREIDEYSDDAKKVCDFLGINLHTVDFSSVFSSKVFQPFINAYRNGRTPNLCVLCNKYIKFGALFEYAKNCGADYIATGHYCSTTTESGFSGLLRAKDNQKDQTYFLNQVDAKVLEQTIFPLADLKKDEVRTIAECEGLITAHKKGSSDICIMGDKSFKDFISEYIEPKEGKILTCDGECVGKHCGVFSYTEGQRKGLGVGGINGGDGRWFVVGKDVLKNEVLVSHDEKKLLAKSLLAKNCNFINFATKKTFSCFAKTRYRQELQKVNVTMNGNDAIVDFENLQRAMTVGQFCVFYDETNCLGGGEIEKVFN